METKNQFAESERARLALLSILEDQKHAEDTLRALHETTIRLQQIIGLLAVSPWQIEGKIKEFAEQLNELVSNALNIERVSVWLFNESQSELHCVDLFEHSKDLHSGGSVLKQEEFENEFNALKSAKFVDADNPLTDPRTKGYVKEYLIPNRITSMLDAVIRIGGKNLGTLCFEHVDVPHDWIAEEIAFASQLADQIAITLYNNDRKKNLAALQENENKFRMVADFTYDWEYWESEEGRIVYMSPSCKRVTGYTLDEFIAIPELLEKIVYPEDLALFKEHHKTSFSTQDPDNAKEIEYRIITKDGSVVVLAHLCRAIYDEQKNFRGRRVSNRDITDRKHAELALKESELKYRELVENSPDAIAIYVEGKIVFVNNECVKLMAAKNSAELIGKSVIQFVHPAYRDLVVERMKKVGAENMVLPPAEEKFIRLDGSEVDVEVKAMAISFEHKPAVQLIVRDITERKQMETALQHQFKELQLIYQLSNSVNRAASLDEIYEKAIDSLIQSLKTDRVSILLFGSDDLMHFKAWHGLSDEYRNAVDGHSPWTKETKNPQPICVQDVEQDPSLEHLQPAFAKEGLKALGFFPLVYEEQLLGKFMIYYNTEHFFTESEIQLTQTIAFCIAFAIQTKRAEEALIASKENYRSVVENIKEVIFKTDAKGLWLFLNHSWEEVTGFSVAESLNTLFLNYVHPDDRQRNAELFEPLITRKKEYCRHEIRYLTKDGGFRWIEVYARLGLNDRDEIIGTYGTLMDITERKKLRVSMQQQLGFAIALNKISAAIISSQSSSDMLEITADILGEALAVDRCLIYKVSFEERQAKGLSEWLNPAFKDIEPTKATYSLDLFISGAAQMLKTKQWLESHIDSINPNFYEDGSAEILHQQMKIKSLLWYPFAFNKDSYYLLALNTTHYSRVWHDDERDFLDSVSKQVSIALEKSRMLEEQRENEMLKERDRQIQETLNAILRMSTEDISLEKSLERTLALILSAPFLSVQQKGGIFLTDKNKDVLMLKCSANLSESLLIMCASVPFGHCLCGRAASTLQVQYMNCIDERHENLYEGIEQHGHYNIPIVSQKKGLGVIVVYLQAGHKREEFEVNFLQAIADILAGLIIRKQTEDELLKLSHAVEQSPASVIITNLQGDIEYVNNKFCKVTGYSKEEVIGKNPRILKSGNQDKILYKELWDTILSGKEWAGELLNKKKNGEMFWESVLISPLVNKKGEITHFVAVKEDITEKKKMINELIESKEAAVRANSVKDGFIANMSHEIRTPLNGLLGMTGIIKELFAPYLKPEDEQLFIGINHSSERIIRTVDMILNYSRLQSEDYPFNPKGFYLSEVCKNLVTEFHLTAKEKGLDLSYENLAGEIMIYADEYSVTQSIANLLDNAIKYTKKGFVKISLSKNENGTPVVEIKDSGIGMNEEYLSHLFEPFRQEDMGYGRAYEGVGLGLSLVKQFLELNNAQISVESKKDVGTTFTVTFTKTLRQKNIKEIEGKIHPKVEPQSQREKQLVLVVEDDIINQVTISNFLAGKYKTLVTASSDEAVEVLETNSVDLILMDISIRGPKNGLELTKELKAKEKFRHIPIIAITAHAFDKDRQNCLAAGCDEYLSKPFTKVELLTMLANY